MFAIKVAWGVNMPREILRLCRLRLDACVSRRLRPCRGRAVGEVPRACIVRGIPAAMSSMRPAQEDVMVDIRRIVEPASARGSTAPSGPSCARVSSELSPSPPAGPARAPNDDELRSMHRRWRLYHASSLILAELVEVVVPLWCAALPRRPRAPPPRT